MANQARHKPVLTQAGKFQKRKRSIALSITHKIDISPTLYFDGV